MDNRSVYVVSEDLHLLLGLWSRQRFGRDLSLPYEKIREDLERILGFGDHKVIRITEDQMLHGIAGLLENERRPIVSVDPVYWPTGLMLQITRCVDPVALCSVEGFYSRFGFPHPDVQVTSIVERLRGNPGGFDGQMVLVDDVVFSGKVVGEVVRRLAEYDTRVVRVVCGVAVVAEGSDPFEMCARLGASLDAAHTFGAEGMPPVVDEICERDFFVFCPMCGRSAMVDDANLCFPYIDPFGRAGSWASFGESSVRVSRELIGLNIRVVQMIEREIGRDLFFADLDRIPVLVRHPAVNSDSVRLHLLAHV